MLCELIGHLVVVDFSNMNMFLLSVVWVSLRNSSVAAFVLLGIDVHEHEAIKEMELDRPYTSQLTYKNLTWYLAGHSMSEMLK